MNNSQLLKIKKWHFALLGLILFNFLISNNTGLGINQYLIFSLKLLLLLSGIIMFFKTVKPFKWSAIYYSIYPFSVLVSVLFLMFGGVMFAILSSFSLYAFYPQQVRYKNDAIKVYSKFQGFLAPCCTYEVLEPQAFFFEKELGSIKVEEIIDFKNIEMVLKNDSIFVLRKKSSTIIDTIGVYPFSK